jgi:hypothetical protein
MEAMPDRKPDTLELKSVEKNEEPVTLDQLEKALRETTGNSAQIIDITERLRQASLQQKEAMQQDPAQMGEIANVVSLQKARSANADDLFQRFLKEQGAAEKTLTGMEELKMRDAKKHADAEAAFTAMPPFEGEMKFQAGETVQFPIDKDNLDKENPQLAYWKIAHAEKGHYLLQRPGSEPGTHEWAIFSEAQVEKYNKREGQKEEQKLAA